MLQLNFTPFPELITERLVLRPVTASDAKEIFSLRTDKEVMKFIDRPIPASIEEVVEWIEKNNDSLNNKDGILWGIALKDDPTIIIGTISFWRIDKANHRAEIGYLIGTSFQGKGLMQEAITTALDYGFSAMKLHSVEANVIPGNTASMNLLERNKFTRDAYFKENYYFNGKYLDSVIYSLLTPVK